LEELLANAAHRGRARVLIVRAGDYFGPTTRNGLVDPIFGNAAQNKSMRMLGDLGIPHQWAFVPDFARLAADLLAIPDKLRPFEIVHFKGDIVDPGREICRLAAAAAGAPDLAVRRTPWWLLRVAGLFNGVARELMEMRYLFDTSIIIEDPRRRELLPDFRPTPLPEAVATTVASYRKA
jgi:nucleoside-diphosphate-sugar epimerase